jgi:hypothetical protein
VDKIAVVMFTTIGMVVFAAGIGLLFAFPIKWCWNYTMPVLFGLKTILWGQAWCLNFLAPCLIKNAIQK